jgi:hypothetical protein
LHVNKSDGIGSRKHSEQLVRRRRAGCGCRQTTVIKGSRDHEAGHHQGEDCSAKFSTHHLIKTLSENAEVRMQNDEWIDYSA